MCEELVIQFLKTVSLGNTPMGCTFLSEKSCDWHSYGSKIVYKWSIVTSQPQERAYIIYTLRLRKIIYSCNFYYLKCEFLLHLIHGQEIWFLPLDIHTDSFTLRPASCNLLRTMRKDFKCVSLVFADNNKVIMVCKHRLSKHTYKKIIYHLLKC